MSPRIQSGVDQPTAAPTNKVAAATVGGAAATLLAFILGEFDVDLTPEAGAALATFLAFAFGYVKRERATVADREELKDRAGRSSWGREQGFVDTRFLLGALCVAVVVLAIVVLT